MKKTKTFIISKFTWPSTDKEAPTVVNISFPTGGTREISPNNSEPEITAGYIVGQCNEVNERCEILFPQEQKIERATENSIIKFTSGLSKKEIKKFYIGFKKGLVETKGKIVVS